MVASSAVGSPSERAHNLFRQQRRVERLGDEAIEASRSDASATSVVGMSTHGDRRKRAASRSERLQEHDSVVARHLNIGDENLWLEAE